MKIFFIKKKIFIYFNLKQIVFKNNIKCKQEYHNNIITIDKIIHVFHNLKNNINEKENNHEGILEPFYININEGLFNNEKGNKNNIDLVSLVKNQIRNIKENNFMTSRRKWH